VTNQKSCDAGYNISGNIIELFQHPFSEAPSGLLQDDPLYYSLGIYDNFTTDGEELDTVCQDAYSVEWRAKTDSIVVTMNQQLASGGLCSSQNGKITVWFSTTGFSAQGSQVGQLC